MSSTEPQKPYVKAMDDIRLGVNYFTGFNTPDRKLILKTMRELKEKRENQEINELQEKENVSVNLALLGQDTHPSGYDCDYDSDSESDHSVVEDDGLAEKDKKGLESDDKKAESDDDTNSEITATYPDTDTESGNDTPPPSPKRKREPTIESQLGAGIRSNVTKTLAIEGVPQGSVREKTGFIKGKTTLHVTKRPQTSTDRKKQQQRYQGEFFMKFTYTAPAPVKDKNQENEKPGQDSTSAQRL